MYDKDYIAIKNVYMIFYFSNWSFLLGIQLSFEASIKYDVTSIKYHGTILLCMFKYHHRPL